MKTPCVSRSIRGFTLLEVLIAVVVLSIGLIGLAALMIQGQKFNRSALHRSQATFIAYDMSDRMRANRVFARTGGYVSLGPTQDTDCLGTSGCTAPEMAGHDVFEWRQIINNVLPGAATGTVGAAGADFDITVNWQEADVDGFVATRTYVLRMRP